MKPTTLTHYGNQSLHCRILEILNIIPLNCISCKKDTTFVRQVWMTSWNEVCAWNVTIKILFFSYHFIKHILREENRFSISGAFLARIFLLYSKSPFIKCQGLAICLLCVSEHAWNVPCLFFSLCWRCHHYCQCGVLSKVSGSLLSCWYSFIS